MTDSNVPPTSEEGKGEPVVFADGMIARANSLDVAAFFGKDHKNVLRDIRKLIGRRPELNRLKFALVERPDAKGELRPTYDMDRDGFTLLAMGFTGEEALDFKLRYIERFNQMEAALRSKALGGGQIDGNHAPEFDAGMWFRLATEARQIWNEEVAAEVWLASGKLPITPGMKSYPRQGNLFRDGRQDTGRGGGQDGPSPDDSQGEE